VGIASFTISPDYAGNQTKRVWSRKQTWNAILMLSIFCLLAGVSACRIAVGNDYWKYTENFELIAQGRKVSSEIGFNIIAWLMQQIFGYRAYLPIFGLYSLVTVFFFVKAIHDQSTWYVASIFLFLANGYYYSSLNNIRYYLVLSIALYSITFLLKRAYMKFVVVILVAALFHMSVLLVLPVYAIAFFCASRKPSRILWVIIALFIASLLLFPTLYRTLIFLIYPFYEGSVFDVARISWINVAKCAATLIVSLICYKDQMKWRAQDTQVTQKRFYFYLNLGALILYTCATYIPEISRVGYYLTITQILYLPMLFRDFKHSRFRTLCMVTAGAAFLLYFAMFLRDAYNTNIRLLPYLTWIFQ
jgi:hypothetical protein